MPVPAEILVTQVRYSQSASAKLLEFARTLPSEHITRQIGNSHGTLLGAFQHIYYADRVWLARLEGKPQPFEDPAPGPSLEDLEKVWLPLLDRFAAFAAACDPGATLRYTNLKGDPFERLIWQIVLHVVNHGTYHRGQIASIMRQLGHQPPATDLIYHYKKSE